MIAYSYLRISTPEQRKGRGVKRQLDDTQQYCKKHGLNLDPKTLQDLGLSGYHGKHITQGALGIFLEGISKRTIPTPCALIIEALDRLTRQQCEEAIFLLLSLVRAGVEVHTVADGMIYKTGEIPMHQLMYSVMTLSTGHQESDRKSGMLKKSWSYKRKEARESGKPMTKIMPEWLTLEDGQIVDIPERVEIVRRIFLETAQGSGKIKIANRINAEGIETWGKGAKKGVRWYYSYIHKILRNRAVLGEFQPHRMIAGKREPEGEPLTNFFPKIITEEEWDAAVISAKSRTIRRDAAVDAPRNIAPGLVYIDGVRAVWTNKGKRTTSDGLRGTKKAHPHGGYWVYYRTLEARNGKTLAQIPAIDIENMILAALQKADGREWLKLLKENDPADNSNLTKRTRIEHQIAEKKESLSRLVTALSMGIGGTATITIKIEEEEKSLAKLQKQLKKIELKDVSPNEFANEIDEIRRLSESGDTNHPSCRLAISQRIVSLFEKIDIGRTPISMLKEKRKTNDNTPFVFLPGVTDRPAAKSMTDPKFFWALLTPRFSNGVRLMVVSHAMNEEVMILLKIRNQFFPKN